MEHLAHEIGMDPLEFRLQNLAPKASFLTGESEATIMPDVIQRIRDSSEYEQRKSEVDLKNQECTNFVVKFKNEISNVLISTGMSTGETPEMLDADGVPLRNIPKPIPTIPKGEQFF